MAALRNWNCALHDGHVSGRSRELYFVVRSVFTPKHLETKVPTPPVNSLIKEDWVGCGRVASTLLTDGSRTKIPALRLGTGTALHNSDATSYIQRYRAG